MYLHKLSKNSKGKSKKSKPLYQLFFKFAVLNLKIMKTWFQRVKRMKKTKIVILI